MLVQCVYGPLLSGNGIATIVSLPATHDIGANGKGGIYHIHLNQGGGGGAWTEKDISCALVVES